MRPRMGTNPSDSQASSMIGTPRSPKSPASSPYRCTGMIARVFHVMRSSTASRSSPHVSGSTSTNTGVAPTARTTEAVAPKVRSGTITSSPARIPRDRSARCSAAVPEDVAMQGRPNFSANARSNAPSNRPACVSQPVSMHSLRYLRSFPSKRGLASGIDAPTSVLGASPPASTACKRGCSAIASFLA